MIALPIKALLLEKLKVKQYTYARHATNTGEYQRTGTKLGFDSRRRD